MFQTGCPLNYAEMSDIWDNYHRSPYIRLCAEIFTSMVLKSVPKIKLRGFDDENSDFMLIQELYHRPFLIQFYIWYHLFEIVPIYKKKIPGTQYYKPMIPPFDAGQIWTEMDYKKKEQTFKWTWKNASDYDRKMYFRVGSHPPGLSGRIHSAMGSLLNDWRTCAIIRQSTEMIAYQQARPQHVFEMHPSKINPGDDGLIGLESFGESIAGSVMMEQEKLSNYRMEVKSEALMNSLKAADYLNYSVKNKYDIAQRSESHGSQIERETSQFLSRGYSLKPDAVYKAVPTPSLGFNLNEHLARLDKVGAALMDIPLQLIEGSSMKSQANMQGNMRFINERMQEWIRLFCDVTKQFFLIAYRKALLSELGGGREIDKEIEVILECTPIANVDDIMRMHKEGLMKKQIAAEHTFNILGLPAEDISVSSWPDQIAKELLLGKKKEPGGGEKSKKLF